MPKYFFLNLVVPEFFQSFTKKPMADAKLMTKGMYSVSLASRAEVDRVVHFAVSLGAPEYLEPEDIDFMYTRSIEDFDGHL